MKIAATIIIILVIFSSCSNSNTAEVRTIDSLLVQLDSVKVTLNQLDSGKLFRYKQEGSDLSKQIGMLTKSLSKDDAIMLDQFLGIHRAFRKWSEKVPDYYEEIHVVPQQLEDLRRDLSRGLIEKDKVARYVSDESNAAIALIESINAVSYGLVSVEPQYLEKREQILALIERLKAENQDAI